MIYSFSGLGIRRFVAWQCGMVLSCRTGARRIVPVHRMRIEGVGWQIKGSSDPPGPGTVHTRDEVLSKIERLVPFSGRPTQNACKSLWKHEQRNSILRMWQNKASRCPAVRNKFTRGSSPGRQAIFEVDEQFGGF